MIASGGLDDVPIFREDYDGGPAVEDRRRTIELAADRVEGSTTKTKSIDYILNPDALTHVARRIIAFLGTLSDSSDRTILSYYAAEKLSGGRDGMRLQLEEDFIRDSGEIAASKQSNEFRTSNSNTGNVSNTTIKGSNVDRSPAGQKVSYSRELVSRSKRSSYSISEENTPPLVLNDFESSGSIGLRSMGLNTSAVRNGLFDDIATSTVDPATDITKQPSSLVQDAILKQQGKDELAKRLQQSQGRDSKVQHVNPEPRRSTTEGHSNSYSQLSLFG